MSVTAMTIDERAISDSTIQNNEALLHKLHKMQSVNSASCGGNVVGGSVIVSVVQPPPASPNHHHQPNSNTTSSSFEQQCRLLEEENQSLKIEQSRLQQQCTDAQRREKILMRRLANKEQEFQDYVSQIAEYKAAQAPGPAALRSALLDPAVNLLFEKLKKELKATKSKLEDTQNELAAWKFTPDSNTGKRLMAKCRLLYQENEELGKMTSNGRLAKLEGELAMQKSFCEEVKKSQSELDDYLQEIDEDVEGMQSTILFLQQELKATRDRIQQLEKENLQMKKGSPIDDLDGVVTTKGSLNGMKEQPASPPPSENTHLPTIRENEEYHVNGDVIGSKNGVGDDLALNTNCNTITVGKKLRKRNYDSDSSDCGSVNGVVVGGPRSTKKTRRTTRRASSVLSLDLNEEDTQIAGEQSDESSNSKIVTRRKSLRNQPPQNGDAN